MCLETQLLQGKWNNIHKGSSQQRSRQAALAGQRLMWVGVGHTGRVHHLSPVSKDREDLMGEEDGGHRGTLVAAALSDLSS